MLLVDLWSGPRTARGRYLSKILSDRKKPSLCLLHRNLIWWSPADSIPCQSFLHTGRVNFVCGLQNGAQCNVDHSSKFLCSIGARRFYDCLHLAFSHNVISLVTLACSVFTCSYQLFRQIAVCLYVMLGLWFAVLYIVVSWLFLKHKVYLVMGARVKSCHFVWCLNWNICILVCASSLQTEYFLQVLYGQTIYGVGYGEEKPVRVQRGLNSCYALKPQPWVRVNLNHESVTWTYAICYTVLRLGGRVSIISLQV